MNLCEYSNIFGKVNTGVHSYRLFNIAIVDLLATILVSYVISIYYQYNILYIFGTMMILSIIIHRIFCVKTTLTLNIFGDF